MGDSYKRCKGGGDCGLATTIPLPGANPADIVYTCATPSTTAPCPPAAGGTCDCFIVATKHGPDGAIDDSILDEAYYAATPDLSNPTKPDYRKMLSGSKQKKDHNPAAKPAGKRPTWWNIRCTCLHTVKGVPQLAVHVIITVPGQAYASTLRELRGRYGRSNVELAPIPAAPEPVRRRRKARRKKA